MKLLNKLVLSLFVCSALVSCSQNGLNQNILTSNNLQPNKIIANNKKNISISKLPANLSPNTKIATDAISKVLKGVDLISESDYEFSINVWQNINVDKFTSAKLLETLKLNKKLKCEDQKKTINQFMGSYATKEYWEGSGYSESEINDKISKYKAFIKETTTHLKSAQIFLVDDPSNLSEMSKSDFSGEVGVYILGKVGNDWIVLKSSLVWTR
jgi:hypothetical protein